MLAAQFQQHPPRFRSHPTHRATVSLHAGRTSRAALVRSDVRTAHDETGLVKSNVQLIAHHLSESRARTLAAICLADVERCGIVWVNHDPSVELEEVRIRIGT